MPDGRDHGCMRPLRGRRLGGRLPGARRALQGQEGRHLRGRGCFQLLPDQEPGRIRRRGRPRDGRPARLRRDMPASQLRPDRKARPYRRGLQLASRRAASRDPFREAARARCSEREPPPPGRIYRMDLEDDALSRCPSSNPGRATYTIFTSCAAASGTRFRSI